MKYLALATILLTLNSAQAAVQEFTYTNITRRTGGAELNTEITGASNAVTLELKVQKYDLVIHDLVVYTEGSEVLTLNDLRRNQNIPTDQQGRLTLSPNRSPLTIYAQTNNMINGISIVAESMGGFATLTMIVADQFAGPPSPGNGDNSDSERACSDQLAAVSGRLAACSNDLVNSNNNLMATNQRILQLQDTLDRMSQPLRQCLDQNNQINASIADSNNRLSELQSRIEQERQQIRSAQYELDFVREGYRYVKCTVYGRNGIQLVGDGPTRGQALAAALRQCTKIACGKHGWNQKYSFEYRK